MTYGRVLCQVVETPARGARRVWAHEQSPDYHDEWMPAEQDWPRDLLPWADPYIAVLMLRLERQYDWVGVADDNPFDDAPTLAAGDWQVLSWHDDFLADDAFAALAGNPWQDDAGRPGWHAGRRSEFPPVFGGFPLLDDVTDGLDEDPV
jgi:hypothetical protein